MGLTRTLATGCVGPPTSELHLGSRLLGRPWSNCSNTCARSRVLFTMDTAGTLRMRSPIPRCVKSKPCVVPLGILPHLNSFHPTMDTTFLRFGHWTVSEYSGAALPPSTQPTVHCAHDALGELQLHRALAPGPYMSTASVLGTQQRRAGPVARPRTEETQARCGGDEARPVARVRKKH